MATLNIHTGEQIDGDAEVFQSLGVLFRSDVGCLLLDREYGSELPRMIDSPIDGSTELQLFSAVADCVDKYEPRFQLERVTIEDVRSNGLGISVSGQINGRSVVLAGGAR